MFGVPLQRFHSCLKKHVSRNLQVRSNIHLSFAKDFRLLLPAHRVDAVPREITASGRKRPTRDADTSAANTKRASAVFTTQDAGGGICHPERRELRAQRLVVFQQDVDQLGIGRTRCTRGCVCSVGVTPWCNPGCRPCNSLSLVANGFLLH